jgi:hypothetical protein
LTTSNAGGEPLEQLQLPERGHHMPRSA